jgi:hypothetical protein
MKVIRFVHSTWSVCQQCNSLRATAHNPDDGHVVVEEGHEMGVAKPGTAQKAALKTVFVYIQDDFSKFQF